MTTKFIFNPFTQEFDASEGCDQNLRNAVIEQRICLETANIGDLVVESEVLVNRVDTVTDNTDVRPVFAVIISKPTTTTCEVLLLGEVGGYSGLTKGRKVFLSETGSFTSTPPTTGYMQSLGVAKEESIVDFNPNMQRVRRT